MDCPISSETTARHDNVICRHPEAIETLQHIFQDNIWLTSEIPETVCNVATQHLYWIEQKAKLMTAFWNWHQNV
jgi:hypothetical protein